MPLASQDIRRQLIPDEITRIIRGAIGAGDLRAGERLIEADLAANLGVSRAALREGLKQLTIEGLLVTAPHRGTFVVELTAADVSEIYSLREALESLAVELLVERATSPELGALRGIIARMQEALGHEDFSAVVDLDMEFHEALCRLSGHSRLHSAWSRMADQLRTFFANADSLYEDWQIIERHKELVDAISTGEKARAVSTLRDHISNAAMRLLDCKTDQRSDPSELTTGDKQ